MQTLSLLELDAEGGGRPAYHPTPDAGPLILHEVMSVADQRLLTEVYRSVLRPAPRLRFELDWRDGVLQSSRRYLQAQADRRGADAIFVVVDAGEEATDLDRVLSDPLLRRHRFQVIRTASATTTGGHLGALRELAASLRPHIEATYRSRCAEVGLDASALDGFGDMLDALVNPVNQLALANDLIDLQLDDVPPTSHRVMLKRRLLLRELSWRRPRDLAALLGWAWRGTGGLEPLDPAERRAALTRLSRQLLRQGDRPARWAAWLTDAEALTGVIGGQAPPIPRPVQREEGWGTRLDAVLAMQPRPAAPPEAAPSGADPAPSSPLGDIYTVFPLLNQGQRSRARRALQGLAAAAQDPGQDPRLRGDYWDAVGRLRLQEGNWPAAQDAFKRSLSLLDEGGASPTSIGITLDSYARGERDHGDWRRARELFDDAIQHKTEGGDSPTSIGITLGEYGRGERDHGDWRRARELFDDAIQHKTEGGDSPTSIGITLGEYGRGERDHGDWRRARELFDDAIQHKTEGGDSPTSIGITLGEYGRGERRHGDVMAAARHYEAAVTLITTAGATPTWLPKLLAEAALTYDAAGLPDKAAQARARAAAIKSGR